MDLVDSNSRVVKTKTKTLSLIAVLNFIVSVGYSIHTVQLPEYRDNNKYI